jgi:hypothetical protein
VACFESHKQFVDFWLAVSSAVALLLRISRMSMTDLP